MGHIGVRSPPSRRRAPRLAKLYQPRAEPTALLLVDAYSIARGAATAAADFEQVLPDKYNSFRAYPHIEARLRQGVSPTLGNVIVQALLRREQLEPDARVGLYADLAAQCRERAPFPHQATCGLTDEQYLRNVVDSLFRTTQEKK